MGYREVILSQNPLSFWPLDDDVVLGVAKEATGKGIDGSYGGSIFDSAMPLVSNGIFGTRLTDASALITYPLPGAIQINSQYKYPYIWTKGKDRQAFSIELYFKMNEDTLSINDQTIIFGDSLDVELPSNDGYQTLSQSYTDYQDILDNLTTYQQILSEATVSRAHYGIYAYKNKIYFKPDPVVDYFVAYEVKDWNRRFHVIANYSEFGISLIVNGESVISKASSTLSSGFSFTQEAGSMKTIGSNIYDITVDAVAIYPYTIDLVRANDHLGYSRKTVLKDKYYNTNSQILYMPNNKDCLIAYKFVNNWTNFDFNNAITNSKNEITLRYASNAVVTGSNYSYTVSGTRSALLLGAQTYLDVSNVALLMEGGAALSMSFYHLNSDPEKGLMSLYNLQTSQSFNAWVNLSNKIVLNLNGVQTVTTVSPLVGWNEILIENKSGSFEVYLNSGSIFSSVDYMQAITGAYIGRVNDLYAECPISWVAFKSGIQTNPLVTHALHNNIADFTLKLEGSLKWSQYGSVTGSIYVPQADYSGSLAFYTTSSPNVSVTYNNGLIWPRMASMPGLLESPVGQINEYTITMSLSTDDSENDLPVLSNVGLYTYSEGMKRVVSDNSPETATIMNIDSSVIYDDDVELLDRLSQSGIRLAGTSYLKIPSQSRNIDTDLLSGTRSISMVIKINEPLSANKHILKSGQKALYWNGTSWVSTGFTKMYVNGVEAFDNQAMINDWAHIVLTSDTRIAAGNDIYVGSDLNGANQLDLTLGVFTMAPYILDSKDVETEYEMLVGYPQEVIATDTVTFSIADYGLISYQNVWQRG
jgi:hypothetical protein